MDQAKTILYKDPNYGSTAVTLSTGRYSDIADASGMPRNAVSSLKVAPFTVVTLYNDRNFGGSSIRVSGPIEVPDLHRYADGFNDKVESVVVEYKAPTKEVAQSCCMGKTGSGSCGAYQPGSALCNDTLLKHCSANMDSAYCQTWCREHPELCDKTVIDWCEKNPNHPYCACIKSKATGVANPKCVDEKCIQYGYLTSNMQKTACPSIIDCRIQATLVNSGVSLSTAIPIEQNCGNTGGATSTSATTSVSTSTSASGATSTSMFYIFILILFVVVIFGSYIAYDWMSGDDVVAKQV